jgi:hypothetical protein
MSSINPLKSSDLPNLEKGQIDQNLKINSGYFKNHKVIRIAGYFPLAGSVAGVARIINAATAENESLSSRTWQVIRGIGEFFWLGPIFAIFDAIFHCVKSSSKNEGRSDEDLVEVENSIPAASEPAAFTPCEVVRNFGSVARKAEEAILKIKTNKFKGILVYEVDENKSLLLFETGDGPFREFDYRKYDNGTLLIVMLDHSGKLKDKSPSYINKLPSFSDYFNRGHQVAVLNVDECDYLLAGRGLPQGFVKKLADPKLENFMLYPKS